MTLRLLLIPYGVFLLLFGVLAVVHLYHLVRFGTFGAANFIALGLFLVGTAAILALTAGLLAPIDWSYPLLSGFGSLTDGVLESADLL